MDKRVKALWIDALQGGEYTQTHGALRREGEGGPSFCCLGVLCDLAIKDGVEVSYSKATLTYDMEGAFLPLSVRKWAGLSSWRDGVRLPSPVMYVDAECPEWEQKAESLIALNDGARYSFDQIANVIAEQF